MRSNQLDVEAAKHLSEGLKANKTLKTLRYADTRRCPTASATLTSSFDSFIGSLGGNKLNVEGAKIMADLLKKNATLTSFGCVA